MNRLTQLDVIYKALYKEPMTMKECDVKTGIMRENICRHCNTLRKSGKLFIVKKRRCKITNHEAYELTTNPGLSPPDMQLTINFELT